MDELRSPLPESFLVHMRDLLGDKLEDFLAEYHKPARRGLRFNLLKTVDVYDLDADPLVPVPWCREGYQYPNQARPAKSILYNAGLFYIQEPSAMCPAAVLRPMPGQRVLDICAAPGGKTVQLAGFMQDRGLIVANDISPSRCMPLVKNLEMSGVTNAVVLAENPAWLASRFPAYFDCILVDAPCSGEGMFRRDPDTIRTYADNSPEICVPLQLEILRHAAGMLKPGGRMVYSTCTFNTLENEGVIASFLSMHQDFMLLPIDHEGLGLACGYSNVTGGIAELCYTARIWPHTGPGEGHFIAHMVKAGSSMSSSQLPEEVTSAKFSKEFVGFCEENLTSFMLDRVVVQHKKSLFLQPVDLDLSGLRVIRSGWHIGEIAKGRFTPSHALAMGITKAQARYAIDLPEPDALRYLKGESLDAPDNLIVQSNKPWVLICFRGFPLGWVRLVQGRLKNQLPAGWVIP